MGADNWGDCPKCNNLLTKKVQTAYGKVSETEYLELIRKRDTLKQTLREDYEIGIDSNDNFSVSYSGSCNVCGFVFNYQHSEGVII